MKISFNRAIVNGPYGGGNHFLKLLVCFLNDRGIETTHRLEKDIDVIVLMEVRDQSSSISLKDIQKYKLENKNVKILHRINENSAHRETTSVMDNLIIGTNKILADKTVFVSHYLEQYFGKLGLSGKHDVVWNGADRSFFSFKPTTRGRSTPINIVTHHWSNNLLKGYAIYDILNQYCVQNPNIANFTFVGNCPHGYLNNAKKISPKPYNEISGFLQECDIYVSASLHEPGGNHIMEGISCGLIPLVVKDGGSCVEYTDGYNFVFNDSRHLISIIETLYNDFELFFSKRNNTSNFTYGSEEMCNRYFEIIMGM